MLSQRGLCRAPAEIEFGVFLPLNGGNNFNDITENQLTNLRVV